MVYHGQIVVLLAVCIQLIRQSLPSSAADGSPAFGRKSDSESEVINNKPKKRKPNIVFILVDDLGFNDVGYHGEGGAALKTPNIDRLAKEGVRLENYYVQPSCTPTRSQLMTGRYQIHTGMQHDNLIHTSPHCLPIQEYTVAQALQSVGYSTHAVGKWHLGFCRQECLPTRRGFDSYLGMILGASDHYQYKKKSGSALYYNETPLTHKLAKYSTFLYTERAEEVIRYHAGSSKPPLFLYVSYQSQHTPLQVPREYMRQYLSAIADTRRLKYAAMLSVVDEGVQNITRSLIANGLWDNTVLIFSTDNGGRPRAGGINWPLRGEKSSLWEGGIRGIAFVTGPVLPSAVRGTINKELCHVSDWFPTLVKGVARKHVTYPLPLDGFNIWRTISQGKSSPRKELLHNIDPIHRTASWTDTDERLWGKLENLAFNATIRAAIRHGKWKLVTGHAGSSKWTPPPESTSENQKFIDRDTQTCIRLFNVRQDPREFFNVATSHPGLVKRLLRRLAELQATAVTALDHSVTITHPVRSGSQESVQPMPLPLVEVTGLWAPWVNGTVMD